MTTKSYDVEITYVINDVARIEYISGAIESDVVDGWYTLYGEGGEVLRELSPAVEASIKWRQEVPDTNQDEPETEKFVSEEDLTGEDEKTKVEDTKPRREQIWKEFYELWFGPGTVPAVTQYSTDTKEK